MASYNRVILMGNLVGDPEIRDIGEKGLARYTVAVNKPGKSKDGTDRSTVLYMDCDHWSPGAVAGFLSKGSQVLVEGELEQQSWEKDGQKRSKIVCKVQRLQLTGSKPREMAGDFS